MFCQIYNIPRIFHVALLHSITLCSAVEGPYTQQVGFTCAPAQKLHGLCCLSALCAATTKMIRKSGKKTAIQHMPASNACCSSRHRQDRRRAQVIKTAARQQRLSVGVALARRHLTRHLPACLGEVTPGALGRVAAEVGTRLTRER